MADYPTVIFSGRKVEDREGVVYDAEKLKVFYSKDHNDLIDEIEAIETILGINPQGDWTSVADYLSGIEAWVLTYASGAEINTGTDEDKYLNCKSIADSKLADYIRGDGWKTAQEAWTYSSATGIYVAGDVTGIYQKGDKIKFTQPTDGQKWMYIIGVGVYDSVNNRTTLTVTAGTSYDLDNEAITSPFFSHEENPFGFPSFFTFTPSDWTGVDNGSGGDPTGFTARFNIRGDIAYYTIFKATSWYKAGAGYVFGFSSGLPTTIEAYTGLGVFSMEWGTDGNQKRMGQIYSGASASGPRFMFPYSETDNREFYGGGRFSTRF